MSLMDVFQWLNDLRLSEAIRNSSVIFPLIEITHLLGLTLLVGTVLVVDVGLLGIGMQRQPAWRLARQLAPWTLTGLVMILATGPLLLIAEAMKISMNPIFPIKMAILLVAVLFHFTVFRKTTSDGSVVTPFRAKLVGGLSLFLWIGTSFIAKVMESF
jgi:uncharacterized protein DUF6644